MAKKSPEERNKFVRERLAEQRHLLKKAIEGMAQGDLSEGLHIASIIRTLVHEGIGKPLFKQLCQNYLELEILDQVLKETGDPSPGGKKSALVLAVPIRLRITTEGYFLNPELPAASHVLTPLGIWWTRPSLIIPGAGGFSRKEIVLGIANKEGGAHVDPDIPTKYQQLLGYKALRVGMGTQITSVNLSRLMVGQSGAEMKDFLDRHFPS